MGDKLGWCELRAGLGIYIGCTAVMKRVERFIRVVVEDVEDDEATVVGMGVWCGRSEFCGCGAPVLTGAGWPGAWDRKTRELQVL